MDESKRIAFVTGFTSGKAAGLERFTVELLVALSKTSIANRLVVYTGARSGMEAALIKRGVSIEVRELQGGAWWREKLRHAPPAALYVYNGLVSPIGFTPRASVAIAYDYAYRDQPSFSLKALANKWKLDFFARLTLKRVQHVVAISEYTRQRTIELFHIPEEKITVMHCGFFPLSKESTSAGAFTNHFLFVGSQKERKNVHGILDGYARLSPAIRSKHPLVLVGKHDATSVYGKRLVNFIEKHELQPHVHSIGHVSDSELSGLYTSACAFVFPSLIEGFGMPILEAMDCGVPVITSNHGAMQEVAGDAALLVDAYSPQSIADAMQKISEDEALRATLIAKGKHRASQFSWEKAAGEILDCLEKFDHDSVRA